MTQKPQIFADSNRSDTLDPRSVFVPEEVAQRVQSYLHGKARAGRETLIIGGFTLYLHGGDATSGISLVLPNHPDVRLAPSALERMGRIFAKRERVACFQFLDSYAAGLADALAGAGYRVQEETSTLICQPGQIFPSAPMPGLEIAMIGANSPPEDVAENWNINALGFDPRATLMGPGDVAGFRSSLQRSKAFTARLHGTGVGAGMYTDILDGVTELVGIATLTEYRRRGIGGALTAFATQTAFADGAELVFLTAASQEAGRVYQKVGFQPVGKLLLLAKKI